MSTQQKSGLKPKQKNLSPNKFYVYRHIRLDNNTPFYVGKGCRSRHLHKHNRNNYWKNIANKYGFRAEKVSLNLTSKEACNLEIKLISLYKKLGYCEANISSGGESGTTGVKPWNYGLKLSKEHAYKCGNAFRGKKRPNHSKTLKAYYKTNPAPALGKPAVNRRAVLCVTTGEVFNSITEAAIKLNLYRQHIGKVCSGKLKTTGGYRFTYYEKNN